MHHRYVPLSMVRERKEIKLGWMGLGRAALTWRPGQTSRRREAPSSSDHAKPPRRSGIHRLSGRQAQQVQGKPPEFPNLAHGFDRFVRVEGVPADPQDEVPSARALDRMAHQQQGGEEASLDSIPARAANGDGDDLGPEPGEAVTGERLGLRGRRFAKGRGPSVFR